MMVDFLGAFADYIQGNLWELYINDLLRIKLRGFLRFDHRSAIADLELLILTSRFCAITQALLMTTECSRRGANDPLLEQEVNNSLRLSN